MKSIHRLKHESKEGELQSYIKKCQYSIPLILDITNISTVNSTFNAVRLDLALAIYITDMDQ